jgi:hypothetical protein
MNAITKTIAAVVIALAATSSFAGSTECKAAQVSLIEAVSDAEAAAVTYRRAFSLYIRTLGDDQLNARVAPMLEAATVAAQLATTRLEDLTESGKKACGL